MATSNHQMVKMEISGKNSQSDLENQWTSPILSGNDIIFQPLAGSRLIYWRFHGKIVRRWTIRSSQSGIYTQVWPDSYCTTLAVSYLKQVYVVYNSIHIYKYLDLQMLKINCLFGLFSIAPLIRNSSNIKHKFEAPGISINWCPQVCLDWKFAQEPTQSTGQGRPGP